MKRTRCRYSASFLLIQLTFAWTFWFLEVRGNLPRQVWHSGAPSIQYSTYVLPVGGSRNKEPCRIASKRGSSPGPSTQKRCSYIGSEDEDGHTIRIDSNGQIPASWKSGPAASLQHLWKHGKLADGCIRFADVLMLRLALTSPKREDIWHDTYSQCASVGIPCWCDWFLKDRLQLGSPNPNSQAVAEKLCKRTLQLKARQRYQTIPNRNQEWPRLSLSEDKEKNGGKRRKNKCYYLKMILTIFLDSENCSFLFPFCR